MCYNAAKGKVFAEIFNVENPDIDIPKIITQWHSLKLGWATDEFMLTRYLKKWNKYDTHCRRLGDRVERRVDRSNWRYNINLVNKGYYIDAHCLRPYEKYKKEIDQLIKDTGLRK